MNTEVQEETICVDCQMAKILEPGKPTSAIDSSHAQCAGSRDNPCRCGCAYSLGKACRRCSRSGRGIVLDLGTCADETECQEFILERQRKRAAERSARMAANPKNKRQPYVPEQREEIESDSAEAKPVRRAKPAVIAQPGEKSCLCGCGESCKSWFRPGHDMRFISSLAAAVQSGEMTSADALDKVSHSDALVAKLQKRLG